MFLYNIGVVKFEHLSYGAESEEQKACFQNLGKEKFGYKNSIFYIHLGYSFISIALFDDSQFNGGIPPPGRGKVGKNMSARSKTTVRSKRVLPLRKKNSGGLFEKTAMWSHRHRM